MVITVEIDDKSKTGKSVLHLLKNLSKAGSDIHFIEPAGNAVFKSEGKHATKSDKVNKKAAKKTLTSYKAKILGDVKQAVMEMKMIKAGKLKSRDVEDLINEL